MRGNVAEIGRQGQHIVEKLLTAKGYSTIQTNVRKGRYEFDVVAFKQEQCLIFEVRTTTKFRLPLDIFPPLKVLTILKGANRYYSGVTVIFVHVLYKQKSKVITTWYTSQDLL